MNRSARHRGAALWRVFVAVVTLLGPLALHAEPSERAPHGLAWNRSGLPAVFPLQVKTNAGRDYRLILLDAANGTAQMAANIHGGTFFRILVPPGRFTLQFDYGTHWQREAAGFGSGADTGRIVVAEPLTFEIRGGSTRSGHLLDLTNSGPAPGQPAVRPLLICQGLRYEPDPRRDPPDVAYWAFEEDSVSTRLARDPRRALVPDRPGLPGDRHLPYLRPEVRSRYCD